MSDIKVDVSFRRFDKDLVSIDTNTIEAGFNGLKNKYPDFFPSYYSDIINLGSIHDSDAGQKLKLFLAFKPTQELFSVIEKKFPTTDEYNKEITQAFKHYKYYFPNDTVPDIIYFPGILMKGNGYYGKFIAVALDAYLGNDYPYEKIPFLPNYLIVKMRPEYLTRNVVETLGANRFEKYMQGNRFVDHMIYTGKLAYFMDAMMPEAPDSVKLGLSSAQLKWCTTNEWQIWAHFVDPKYKVLYTTDADLISRYFEEGPNTNAPGVQNVEGNVSAPRFAMWTGHKIVKKYMDKNPKITLAELMQNTNHDQILKESGYKP